jgi:hypothetical protein
MPEPDEEVSPDDAPDMLLSFIGIGCFLIGVALSWLDAWVVAAICWGPARLGIFVGFFFAVVLCLALIFFWWAYVLIFKKRSRTLMPRFLAPLLLQAGAVGFGICLVWLAVHDILTGQTRLFERSAANPVIFYYRASPVWFLLHVAWELLVGLIMLWVPLWYRKRRAGKSEHT